MIKGFLDQSERAAQLVWAVFLIGGVLLGAAETLVYLHRSHTQPDTVAVPARLFQHERI